MYFKIRQLCKEKNISINELEEILGFGRGSLCKWNKTSPSVERIAKVASYFGISIEELLIQNLEE